MIQRRLLAFVVAGALGAEAFGVLTFAVWVGHQHAVGFSTDAWLARPIIVLALIGGLIGYVGHLLTKSQNAR